MITIFFAHYIKSTSHISEPNTFSRDLVVIRDILKLSTFFFQMARERRTKCRVAVPVVHM